MAFADPQALAVDSRGTLNLPRVSVQENQSTYRTDDDSVELLISSQYGRRNRRTFRVNHSKISADPFIPSQNSKVSASFYVVIDEPAVGYTNAEVVQLAAGVMTALSASSFAATTKLAAGEN